MKTKIITAPGIGHLLALLLLTTPGTSPADTLFVPITIGIEALNSSGVGTVFTTWASGSASTSGLAFDNAGNLYAVNASSATIEKYNPSGEGTVFASGINAWAIAFDSVGNLYVSSGSNIEKFNSAGVGTPFAHSGQNGFFTSLAFDSAGNLFAADPDGGIIEKFDSSGVGTVFANPVYNYQFTCLAFDSSGSLYAANNDGTIEKFNSSGESTVFASSGLSYPSALAFDSAGTLYAANEYNGTIVKFDSSGNPTVFANTGPGGSGPYAIAFAPPPQAILATGMGVWINQFALKIIGSSNQIVFVEACTNLTNPVWTTIGTNTLNTFLGTNGTAYFNDAQWTNYPARFYRVRSF